MANFDEDGLTAEFPFPGCVPPTALLTASNAEKHPRFGSGLLLLPKLPLACQGVDVESLAFKLNAAEVKEWTHCHFMGAWCVDPNLKTPTYCSFFPSALYKPGLLGNCIYSMAHRARWANEYLVSQEGIAELFGPRNKEDFNQQIKEYWSLVGLWRPAG